MWDRIQVNVYFKRNSSPKKNEKSNHCLYHITTLPLNLTKSYSLDLSDLMILGLYLPIVPPSVPFQSSAALWLRARKATTTSVLSSWVVRAHCPLSIWIAVDLGCVCWIHARTEACIIPADCGSQDPILFSVIDLFTIYPDILPS